MSEPRSEFGNCRGCGKPIRWVASGKSPGKFLICDPELVTADGTIDRLRLVTPDGFVKVNPPEGLIGYIDHHATCPKADSFRSRDRGKVMERTCPTCGFDYSATQCPRCS